MKPKLLALFLLISVGVHAQTKQVSHSDYTIGRKEVYNVLKGDKNIREGAYKLYLSGSLLVEGYYHNNQKDSVWKYYSGRQLVAQGAFKNGQKTGVWTGYTRGFERLKYDFGKQTLLNYVPSLLDSALQYKTVETGSPDTIERVPVYFNGIATLNRIASRSIRYPSEARAARKQGEVTVIFTIDENGTPGNYAVKSRIGYELDDVALNAIKNIEGEWVPALVKGKPIAVQCEVSVLFAISSGGDVLVKPNQILILAVGVPSVSVW